MASWSEWSDSKKWFMGILSALIVAAVIGFAGTLLKIGGDPAGDGRGPTIPVLPEEAEQQTEEERAPASSEREPEQAEPATTSGHNPPQPVRELTEQDFIFKLAGCVKSGSNVRCEILVTDLVGDRDFKMDSGQITDVAGNVYAATRFFLGAENGPFHVHAPLPAGVPTKAALDFKSVRPEASLLEVLELKGHTLDRARSQVTVRFPKIPL